MNKWKEEFEKLRENYKIRIYSDLQNQDDIEIVENFIQSLLEKRDAEWKDKIEKATVEWREDVRQELRNDLQAIEDIKSKLC